MKKHNLTFQFLINLAWVALLVLTPALQGATPVAAQADEPADQSVNSGDWLSDIQQQLASEEYFVTWQEQTYLADLPAAYQAPNREQNLRTYFSSQGISVIPRQWEDGIVDPPWRWDINLEAWGNQDALRSEQPGELIALENAIQAPHGSLVQSFRNEPEGLRLGMQLEQAPDEVSGSPVSLVFRVGTGLTAQAEGTSSLVFMHDGIEVLRLASLAAQDAAGQSLPVTLALDGDLLTWQVDASNAVYPISTGAVITGLPTTYKIMFIGSDTSRLGYSVATAGDVNNDGYSDVILGLPEYDGGETDEGRALIYASGPNGPYVPPIWSKEGNQAGAHFGFSVSPAGDVNRDMYADVIVGAPYYDHPEINEGGAWVYQGKSDGVNSAPSFFAQGDQADANLGWSVAFAGDANKDTFSDIIVGAINYDNVNMNEGWAMAWYGSLSGINGGANGTPSNADWHAEGQEDNALLGISVASAGDVNGDEYFDIIVGASQFGDLDNGEAFLWYGGDGGVNDGAVGIPSNADWRTNRTASTYKAAHIGLSVSSAGDVNGDGYGDVIVGLPHYSDATYTERGVAFLYLGSEVGLPYKPDNVDAGEQSGAWFGFSVACAGDVNGDGYADVVVGSPLYTNGESEEGRAYLWYGNKDGISTTRDWSNESNIADAWYGTSVATAGDVNGDGYSDLLIGSPNEDSSSGRAYVYLGSADLPDATANWTKRSNQVSANFGFSVASAGDVNGDGFGDVIIGADLWDDGQLNEGGVWIYRGAADGLVDAPYWYKQGDLNGAGFGHSVASAGDVNGDGYSDVVVGAPYWEDTHTDEGGVWVYYGSTSGVNPVPAWAKTSDQAYAWFGKSVASAGDINGDGYGDLVAGAPLTDHGENDEGVAWVYLGSASGLSTTPHTHLESDQAGARFGHSVASAGDVNADGYSDLVVGAPYWEDDENTSEGRAYLYHGSANGLDSTLQWHAEANNWNAHMGWSVASAGDVNGDGRSDVIVSASYYGDDGLESEGKVWVFHGSDFGLNSSPSWSKESGRESALYGYSVASAGDVNGDGYADVLIGAPGMIPEGGAIAGGLARLYTGSQDGLGSSYAWTGIGGQESAFYGVSVASAGDVNGDAYADIIIGANRFTDGPSQEGKAFVHYGNGCNGFPINLQLLNLGVDDIPVPNLGRADPANVAARFHQWSPFGFGDYNWEIEVKPVGVVFDGSGLNSDYLVWSPLRPPYPWMDQLRNLSYNTAYHWRMRLRLQPTDFPWMPASRWVTVPLGGWNETDFRTITPHIYLPLIVR